MLREQAGGLKGIASKARGRMEDRTLTTEFLICSLSFRILRLSEALESRQPGMQTKRLKKPQNLQGVSSAFPNCWLACPLSLQDEKRDEEVGDSRLICVFAALWFPSRLGNKEGCLRPSVVSVLYPHTHKGPSNASGIL